MRSKSFYHQNQNQLKSAEQPRAYALSSYRRSNFKSSSSNVLNRPGSIKHNNVRSFNSSHQTISDKSKISVQVMDAYGVKHRKAKVPNMFEDFPINPRGKDKKIKIEHQIGDL